MSLLRVELTLDSLGLGLKISISSCTVHILLILFLVDCRQEVWRRRSTCTRSWWLENSALARPPSSRDTSTSSSPSTTELLYPYLLHTSQNSQSSVTNQLAGCHVSLVQWVKGLEFESSGSFCFTIISLQLFMKYFLKMISFLLSFHTLHRKNQSLMKTNYFEKSFLSCVYMFSYIDIFFSRVFIKEIIQLLKGIKMKL